MKPEDEKKVMLFWKKNDLYKKAKKIREKSKKFYFLDGPPYASGNIHMGTAWNKILKDAYIRFWRMRGFDVWDKPGYDTHGLPIEKKVEGILKFERKGDIEKFGIAQFNKECMKFATEHISTMNSEFEDLGVWMDFDNPYLTLKNEYIESAWHTFKVAFDKGLLYRGVYSVHVCPLCETAVAYNEIEYHKMSDDSIYVKFPAIGQKNTFFLIWTTTPWTLLSNTGIMVNPKADYVKVKLQNKEEIILAKDLLEKVLGESQYKIIEIIKGKKLKDMKYKNPLESHIGFSDEIVQTGYRVVLSEQYVSLGEGTGLVHTAPGHGKEDYKVGVENGLPIVCPMGLNGTFNNKCGSFSGKNVLEANRLIIEELDSQGYLFNEEKIVHDYPCCWRCSSKLLLMAVPQWFFKITDIREKLIEENKKVNWYPDWAKSRFHNWLESLGDWPVSRQRYWGIPLPIWTCDSCDKIEVIGSMDQLAMKGLKVPKDLHRPYIDEVKFPCSCGSEMKRIGDVLDVWFDSGVASWGSLEYPQNKENYEELWPADLNIEGPDQIRGWWNSQMITSVIAFNRSPFKNILFHGFMLDAHGVKMSKSKGNIIAPPDVIAKYGRDLLRLYLLSSAPWDDYYFNWKNADALAKQTIILENTFEFVKTYVPRVKKGELKTEDLWILSRLNSLIKRVTEHMEKYNIHKASSEITDFIITDFSRTYIKLIRDRVWPAYGGDDGAFWTLYEVSKVISRLLAPIIPFTAEKIHQDILKPLGETIESVHLCNWPPVDSSMINEDLEKYMQNALKIVEVGNSMRQDKKVKLRWPLNLLVVNSDDKEIRDSVKACIDIIKRMSNVKHVRLGTADEYKESEGLKVYVDTKLTIELEKEAIVRELVRKIQNLRKQNKMVVDDKINLYLSCDPDYLLDLEDNIKKEVGAKNILYDKIKGKKDALELFDKNIEIGIEKL